MSFTFRPLLAAAAIALATPAFAQTPSATAPITAASTGTKAPVTKTTVKHRHHHKAATNAVAKNETKPATADTSPKTTTK